MSTAEFTDTEKRVTLWAIAAALVVVLLIPELPMRDIDALRAEAPDKDGDTVMPVDAHL